MDGLAIPIAAIIAALQFTRWYAFGAGPVWLGVALIALGMLLVKSMSRAKEAEPGVSG
ncbi:hypothetical protein OHU45_32005 [Streptomyces tubercidicus]|uniref:hypothetical protein n=1 Tax=Streptomyces tubercidicus TaxID=47759 RepID=UPI0030DF1830